MVVTRTVARVLEVAKAAAKAVAAKAAAQVVAVMGMAAAVMGMAAAVMGMAAAVMVGGVRAMVVVVMAAAVMGMAAAAKAVAAKAVAARAAAVMEMANRRVHWQLEVRPRAALRLHKTAERVEARGYRCRIAISLLVGRERDRELLCRSVHTRAYYTRNPTYM